MTGTLEEEIAKIRPIVTEKVVQTKGTKKNDRIKAWINRMYSTNKTIINMRQQNESDRNTR